MARARAQVLLPEFATVYAHFTYGPEFYTTNATVDLDAFVPQTGANVRSLLHAAPLARGRRAP